MGQSDVDTVLASVRSERRMLSRCPFCGSYRLQLFDCGRAVMVCRNCGAQGPEVEIKTTVASGDEKAKAVALWNTRKA